MRMHAATERQPTSATKVLSAAVPCLDLSLGGAAHTTALLPLQCAEKGQGAQQWARSATLTQVVALHQVGSTLAWMSLQGCSFVAAPTSCVTLRIQPGQQQAASGVCTSQGAVLGATGTALTNASKWLASPHCQLSR